MKAPDNNGKLFKYVSVNWVASANEEMGGAATHCADRGAGTARDSTTTVKHIPRYLLNPARLGGHSETTKQSVTLLT